MGVAACVVITALAAVGACRADPGRDPSAIATPRRLVGQVLLPPGGGSRGVEVVITVADAGGEPHDRWLLFDEQGRFAHDLQEDLIRVTVSTGIRAELHRIESDELPAADAAGTIDLGAIDLRERLTRHRLVLCAAEGAPPGAVRVAMCFGPPPLGPGGGRISLGSRQFPPIALGGEVEWLLPPEASSIHFLVERPRDPDPDSAPDSAPGSARGPWRSGRQRLFGPFTATSLPTELIMD